VVVALEYFSFAILGPRGAFVDDSFGVDPRLQVRIHLQLQLVVRDVTKRPVKKQISPHATLPIARQFMLLAFAYGVGVWEGQV
jgi:hypothetical protein